jgi:hypothetical protein
MLNPSLQMLANETTSGFSFWQKILPNFNLKNMIFQIYKGNFIEKIAPSLPDYEEFFFSKLPDFYDKFQ